MKRLILLTGCLIFFAAASHAQDTLKIKPYRRDKALTQSDELRKREAEEGIAGWTRIQSKNIPGNLRTALDAPEYKGWETGNVYVNETNKVYQLRISGPDAKVYYFDVEGRPAQKPDKK